MPKIENKNFFIKIYNFFIEVQVKQSNKLKTHSEDLTKKVSNYSNSWNMLKC